MEIIDLDRSNLDSLMASLLESEKNFHPDTRYDAAYFRRLVLAEGAISKVALVNKEYAGNIIACCTYRLNRDSKDDIIDPSDTIINPKILYIMTTSVQPKFQRQGIGRALRDALRKDAKKAGYTYLEGHANEKKAMPLVRKYPTIELSRHLDWDPTGQPHIHYLQPLFEILIT